MPRRKSKQASKKGNHKETSIDNQLNEKKSQDDRFEYDTDDSDQTDDSGSQTSEEKQQQNHSENSRPIKKNKGTTKKSNKNKNKNKILNEEEEETDEDFGTNEVIPMRKVPLILNSEYDVPPCYAKYFPKTTKEVKLKFIIKTTKVSKNKHITVISWDTKCKSPFSTTNIKEIKAYFQKKFSAGCSNKPNSIAIQGKLNAYHLIDYFVKNFKFNENDFECKNCQYRIPKEFQIEIIFDENKDDVSEVILPKQKWESNDFDNFVDSFESAITNEWNMTVENKKTVNKKLHITIKGENADFIFNNYFIETCGMKPTEIRKQKKLLDSKRYSKINTYREMVERFTGFDPSSYFLEMSETIQDTYFNEREKLRQLIYSVNLQFNYSFYDRKERLYYWNTYINIANVYSHDGKTSNQISEGFGVIIKHKNTNKSIQGMVSKIWPDGWASIEIILRDGEIPPGCNYVPPGVKNPKEANYRDFDELGDDENDEISQYEQKMMASPYGSYIVKFKPNKSVYKKSSKALLILNDIESPIKDIITSDNSTIDESINKVSNETITETSYDLRDLPTVQEYKDNPNIMKYLHLTPTQSQIECINSILQHRISLIQGPPGCGKTTSIGFFVYQLLNMNKTSQKRILLCAYSNQAVENIVKFVFPIVKALGKKMVWIPKKASCFETEKDFNNATDVEKNLSYYKILADDKAECAEYKQLQIKKWRYEEEAERYYEAKRAGKLKFYSYDKTVQYFTEKDQKRMSDIQVTVESKFVAESDVVCCTLLQSAKSSIIDYKFDYVFIDEATQVDQINSIIPLIHQPSKMILLGDHKQLDPFISQDMKELHPYTTQSLYSYLISKKLKHVMLKTQFRMNPLIAQFPNQQFYNNCIESADDMENKTKIELVGVQTPILFVDVKDGVETQSYGTSFKNDLEAEIVVKILNNIQMNNIPGSEVGVITPYYGQKQLLRDKTSCMNYNGVRISSVDSFQGSERDFIILSLVRTNENGKFGFLSNENRINVSITRAKKGMIIVGNFNAIVNSNKNDQNPKNEFLVNMCKFYEKNKAVVDSSSIQKISRVIPVPVSKISYKKPLTKDDIEYDYDDDYDE